MNNSSGISWFSNFLFPILQLFLINLLIVTFTSNFVSLCEMYQFNSLSLLSILSRFLFMSKNAFNLYCLSSICLFRNLSFKALSHKLTLIFSFSIHFSRSFVLEIARLSSIASRFAKVLNTINIILKHY